MPSLTAWLVLLAAVALAVGLVSNKRYRSANPPVRCECGRRFPDAAAAARHSHDIEGGQPCE